MPENIKNIRSKAMIEVTTKTMTDFLNSQVGRVESVLFEREKNGFYEGYTKNYTHVVVKSDENLSNKIYDVKITGVQDNKCTAEILK